MLPLPRGFPRRWHEPWRLTASVFDRCRTTWCSNSAEIWWRSESENEIMYEVVVNIIMNAQKSPVWKVGSPSKLRCTNSWPHQIDSMVFVFGWPTNLEQNVMALRCGNFGDLLNGSRCQTMSRPLRPRPLKWIQDPTSNIIQGCSNVGNVQALEISCHWYHEGSQGLGNV